MKERVSVIIGTNLKEWNVPVIQRYPLLRKVEVSAGKKCKQWPNPRRFEILRALLELKIETTALALKKVYIKLMISLLINMDFVIRQHFLKINSPTNCLNLPRHIFCLFLIFASCLFLRSYFSSILIVGDLKLKLFSKVAKVF